ncbi:MAG: UDP-N-acetylmuramoyl-L-alanine--D-glutamate ligase [Clostridia bacterium]|nr:UDP-N-acetylmuramoyl-L-alanine--D-glutamate ligase [Clostridia bacterium]
MKLENTVLKQYLHGRSCDILGLGVSNLPLAEQLHAMGISLTVRDKKPLSELGDAANRLAREGVSFITGDGCFDAPKGEVIFRSPGIRPDLPGLLAAKAAGAELTSEIELFLKLTNNTTYAITGSDGKTTSTTLTGKFLSAEMARRPQGKVFVGGNIGAPLLDRLPEMDENDPIVMELSSFQLMTLEHAPTYAAITNLSPNHLDWHGNMEEYIRAKTRIIGSRTRRLVISADCPITAELAKELLARRRRGKSTPDLYLFSSHKTSFTDIFGEEGDPEDRALFERNGTIYLARRNEELPILSTDTIRIPGRHNLENFMTAIGLTFGQADPSVYRRVAEEFRGVEHRLEWIRTLNGVDYYNSSIDSSPTRTAAALSALDGRDIVIICGGYDKKIPFEPLAESLIRHVRAVVLTGATGEKIGRILTAHPNYRPGQPEAVYTADFTEAVHRARALSRPGGCVLLSPACASFDAFRNFAERGNTFRKIVEAFEN